MDYRSLAPPDAVFRATIGVPGDKSLSHRALLFAAMAVGRSEVTGLGTGRDVAATASGLRSLGVEVGEGYVVSPGVDGWRPPAAPIDCANSGTTLRLLAGVLGAQPFRTTLTGDESLRRRPMRRLVEPLGALGIRVEVSEDGTAPISVSAPGGTRGAVAQIDLASAQVRSAFELAAVQAEGESAIDGPGGFRDHTERWLQTMGLGAWETETRFRVRPGKLPAGRFAVPGDPSSAAFLWAAAALMAGAEVVTPRVSLNPGRTGFLDVLAAMGTTVAVEETGHIHGDPVGTVRVRGEHLSGTVVDGALAVRTLDELPLVAVLAAHAGGTTTVAGAAELRAKESDRISSTVAMVRGLGGEAEATPDGFVVQGRRDLEGGTVDSRGDHRIAMAAAVAATATRRPVTITDPRAAGVSWPEFYETLEAAWSSR